MTKRTERPKRKRPLVRGQPVIRNVLALTLDELASRGFAALRVEDVALRAAVNKTTIYRRWPTKAALVRAALLSIAGGEVRVPDTGSLRRDLVQIAHDTVNFATAPQGRSVIRMILAEGPDSELRAIAQSLHDSFDPLRKDLVRAALARGEVAGMEEGLLLLELLDAAIHFRLFVSQVEVDEAFIERLADVLVSRGAASAPASTGRKAPPRRTARALRAASAERRARRARTG